MLNGPDIRTLIKKDEFSLKLTENQRDAWVAIRAVSEGVLGNNRVQFYEELVKKMFVALKKIRVTISLKLHFLNNHLDIFAKQSPAESDQQGEKENINMENSDSISTSICFYLTCTHYKHAQVNNFFFSSFNQFHQLTMPMEQRFKGKNVAALLGDVCWISQKVSLYDEQNIEDEV